MTNLILCFGLGGWEITAIVLIVLILFGGKKIPELMRGVGKGIREFNAAKSSIRDGIEEGMKEDKDKPSDKKED